MKKVLILAYDFPPYVSVGGLRPYSWYKYLKEFGVYPVVVTRQWSNKYGNYLDYVAPGYSEKVEIEKSEKGVVLRVPYKPTLANKLLIRYGHKRFKLLRKAITAYYEILQWVLPFGPKYAIYKAAKEYMSNNEVDAVIATGEPFILMKYAYALAVKNNIRWIADFRDPFYCKIPLIKNLLIKTMIRILKSADYVTTPSEYFGKILEKHLMVKVNKIKILTNGFDDDLLNVIPNKTENRKKDIVITLAGTILRYHPLEPFLDVMCEFVDYDFIIKFVGINDEARVIKFLVNCPKLKEKVIFLPKMDNITVYKELVNSDLLLLFNYYENPGTKIYDYIAAGKKILFCFTDDKEAINLKEKYFEQKSHVEFNKNVQVDILLDTNCGIIIKDKEDLKKKMQEIFNTPEYNFICKNDNIRKYGRKQQAKKLAEIIKHLTF